MADDVGDGIDGVGTMGDGIDGVGTMGDGSELEPGTWKHWFRENILLWILKDPYGFLYTVLLVLSPLFIISGILSYILYKDIEKKEKDKKRKAKRESNQAKARGRSKKDN